MRRGDPSGAKGSLLLALAILVSAVPLVVAEGATPGMHIALFSDRASYPSGEVVRLTVGNDGTEPANGTLYLSVHGADNATWYASEATVALGANSSVTREWTQRGTNNTTAPAGSYVARAYLLTSNESGNATLQASTNFQIEAPPATNSSGSPTSNTTSPANTTNPAPTPTPNGTFSPTNGSSKAAIQLRTDQFRYAPGANVTFGITNTGNQSIAGLARVEIHLAPGGAFVRGLSVNASLAPYANAYLRWDQRDEQGIAASPGNYTATATLGEARAYASFAITASPPTYTQPAAIGLRSDNGTYLRGAPVTFRLTNEGNATLNGPIHVAFLQKATGSLLRSVDVPSQALIPGAGISFSWDQRDQQGQQVPDGSYAVEASFAGGHAGAHFVIGGPYPTPPPSSSPSTATCCSGASLDLTLDQKQYELGQTIALSIRSAGTYPLRGPFYLGIATLAGEPVRKLYAGERSVDMTPGSAQNATWDQRDDQGGAVGVGCYMAMAVVGSSRDSQPFALGSATCGSVTSYPRPIPEGAKAVASAKPWYNQGEPVVIRLTNLASSEVRGDVQLEIRDGPGLARVALITVLGTRLAPGASLDTMWNQRDAMGQQAPRGCYAAIVRWEGFRDSAAFGLGASGCGGPNPGPAPVAWEDRGTSYWDGRYANETDWSATLPKAEASAQSLASFWTQASPEVREALRRQAEDKKLFGSFDYQAATGAVSGDLVRFAYDAASGAVTHYDIRRGGAWASLFDRVVIADFRPSGAPFVAGPLFRHAGDSAAVEAYSHFTAPLIHRAIEGGNLVTYALASGETAEQVGPHAIQLRGSVDALLVLMGPGNITLSGSTIAVKLDAYSAVAVLAKGNGTDAPWNSEAGSTIHKAVATGSVGAELTIVAGNGTSGDVAVPYSAVQLRTKLAKPGHVSVGVTGQVKEGKAVILNVDGALIPGGCAAIEVRFDGQRIAASDDLADALTIDAGEGAEYYAVEGKAGCQVVVQVPHFSEHTVDVESLPPELVQPLLTLGLVAGIALIVGLSVLMIRPPKYRI